MLDGLAESSRCVSSLEQPTRRGGTTLLATVLEERPKCFGEDDRERAERQDAGPLIHTVSGRTIQSLLSFD